MQMETQAVAEFLCSKKILTTLQLEVVFTLKLRYEQAIHILFNIYKKVEQFSLDHLREALVKTEQNHLAQLIEGNYCL